MPATRPAVFQMMIKGNRDGDGDCVLMWRECGLLKSARPGFKSGPWLGNLQAVGSISSFLKWEEHHLLYMAFVT